MSLYRGYISFIGVDPSGKEVRRCHEFDIIWRKAERKEKKLEYESCSCYTKWRRYGLCGGFTRYPVDVRYANCKRGYTACCYYVKAKIAATDETNLDKPIFFGHSGNYSRQVQCRDGELLTTCCARSSPWAGNPKSGWFGDIQLTHLGPCVRIKLPPSDPPPISPYR